MKFLAASWIMPGSTIVVGLNGALQKRFILPQDNVLIPGNVHRAAEIQVGVGGKGQDVALSLSCLEVPSVQLAQFVGSGPDGDVVLDLLKGQIGEDAATSLTVRPKSQMRTCTTIVASDDATELVEPSGVIEKDERNELMRMLTFDENKPPAALCFMGSMPPGCPSSMYGDIYKASAGPNTLCVIDSVAGLDDLLEEIGKQKGRGPVLLKVNASELCKLAGVAKKSSESGGIADDELVEAVREFMKLKSPTIAGFALTDGKHPAHLVHLLESDFSIYRIGVPDLSKEKTLYPIGAGDSVAAGALASWKYLRSINDDKEKEFLPNSLQQALLSKKQETAIVFEGNDDSSDPLDMAMALSFGVACGSASCLSTENSIFDVDTVRDLFSSLDVPKKISTHAFVR